MWAAHTWEIFWGQGNSIKEAMEDLENRKLSRAWTGINWIGESSSLTGTDAIAWNGLGQGTRNPKNLRDKDEKAAIDDFYDKLSAALESSKNEVPEGKVLDLHESLSIPELVKRLVTLSHTSIPHNLGMEPPEKFSELVRKPDREKNIPGQWTGWFMGDGDKVGDYLKNISNQPDGETKIQQFSQAMRSWGSNFMEQFPQDLVRVIYAGGDDFLGVIYSKKPTHKSSEKLKQKALHWLMGLKQQWEQHGQDITLSVGFVWVAGSVPQRDILQHCREAEAIAKELGRDRLTIRVVFNSGQYVQWTCPWNNLSLLSQYQDRDKKDNWSHIYNDLAQLKARHALSPENKKNFVLSKALLNIYFNNQGDKLFTNRTNLVGDSSPKEFINWVDDLIQVGWQLCG